MMPARRAMRRQARALAAARGTPEQVLAEERATLEGVFVSASTCPYVQETSAADPASMSSGCLQIAALVAPGRNVITDAVSYRAFAHLIFSSIGLVGRLRLGKHLPIRPKIVSSRPSIDEQWMFFDRSSDGCRQGPSTLPNTCMCPCLSPSITYMAQVEVELRTLLLTRPLLLRPSRARRPRRGLFKGRAKGHEGPEGAEAAAAAAHGGDRSSAWGARRAEAA